MKSFLVDWVGVTLIRTAKGLWWAWALILLTHLFGWVDWRDSLIPAIWLTGLLFATLMAFRKYEQKEQPE